MRDLKAKLSAVLRSVERGERVRVTSRGRPVADIVPPQALTPEQRLDELEATGQLTRPTKPWPKKLSAPEPHTGGQLPSEWIIAERDRHR